VSVIGLLGQRAPYRVEVEISHVCFNKLQMSVMEVRLVCQCMVWKMEKRNFYIAPRMYAQKTVLGRGVIGAFVRIPVTMVPTVEHSMYRPWKAMVGHRVIFMIVNRNPKTATHFRVLLIVLERGVIGHHAPRPVKVGKNYGVSLLPQRLQMVGLVAWMYTILLMKQLIHELAMSTLFVRLIVWDSGAHGARVLLHVKGLFKHARILNLSQH
jgi:hypothetical protein